MKAKANSKPTTPQTTILLANPLRDSESASFDATENRSEENTTRSIFERRSATPDDREGDDSMWTLKRANPVFDSDSEDEDELSEFYASPAKRLRVKHLDWEQSLDSGGRHNIRFLTE